MATATKQPKKQSATVRIGEQAHRRLRELTAQDGEPLAAASGNGERGNPIGRPGPAPSTDEPINPVDKPARAVL